METVPGPPTVVHRQRLVVVNEPTIAADTVRGATVAQVVRIARFMRDETGIFEVRPARGNVGEEGMAVAVHPKASSKGARRMVEVRMAVCRLKSVRVDVDPLGWWEVGAGLVRSVGGDDRWKRRPV